MCFQFLRAVSRLYVINGHGCAEGGWTGPGVARESVGWPKKSGKD